MKTIHEKILTDSDKERFWSKVDVKGPDDCWVWTGTCARGYGQFCVTEAGQSAMLRSHRVAYQISNGEIPIRIHVLHRCDNRPCCNPAHLFTGTNADNIADKVKKGRQANGEALGELKRGMKNKNSKLTESDVLEIRRRAPSTTQRKLAAEYGVFQTNISAIVTRKSWNHV